MLNPLRRRRAGILLTITFLTTSPAWAAGWPAGGNEQPEEAARSAPATLLDRAWSLIAALWVKEGCGIDPSGRCFTGTAQQQPGTKEGCHIDPSGLCENGPAQTPPPQPKAGCHIDPNGHCIP